MFALLRQLAARTESSNLVHAHVEKLLELCIFFGLRLWAIFDEDCVVVVVDEYVEVVAENCRSLEERIMRLKASVRPHLEVELVVVSTLTDTSVLNRILHAANR
jgi:hypothetical protein